MTSRPEMTERVWQALHADLRRFIGRRVRDETEAEDLLQEVFVRIHDRMDSLKDSERLRAWVYQIARNAVSDHYRSQRPATKTVDAELVVLDDDRNRSSNLNAEVATWMQALVEELPDDYRKAVQLAELDGKRQQQVADELGLSLSGAKSRIQRGRKMLKEALLRCCHLELDQRGNVLSFDRRQTCDSCCGNDKAC